MAGCTQSPLREPDRTGSNPTKETQAHALAETSTSPATESEPSTKPAGPTTPAPTDSTNTRQNALPFKTRYAQFEPALWTELPGWRDDDLYDAWQAFRQSCTALGKKPAWEPLCGRSTIVKPGANAIRQFFEREFTPYQIRNVDRSPTGVITGYYEPLLAGSRSYSPPFIYPVLGKPNDMLYLDIRMLPPERRGVPIVARLAGEKVIPVLNPAPAEKDLYTLDIGGASIDIRDKKVRLRLQGKRIVPYYTRAEIERRGLEASKVLAWTKDPAALYSMQIQGAGKIWLSDGEVVRFAYAEQNGHPFRPTVVGGEGSHKPRTRGLPGTTPDDLETPDFGDTSDAETTPILTRGFRLRGATAQATSSASASDDLPPEVAALVEALSAGKSVSGATTEIPTPRPRIDKNPLKASQPQGGTSLQGKPVHANSKHETSSPSPAPTAPANWPAAISADPSYVFFREIPNSDDGPLGALGVPLTAGRSLAVDPRTTPLGFPVFVATTEPGGDGNLNRLMLAQDTGGAIRGAVRADYFWGFGKPAYAQASRMKADGRMWLLLPKEQQIAAKDVAVRVRSLGGHVPADREVECVVADPDLCVEDGK